VIVDKTVKERVEAEVATAKEALAAQQKVFSERFMAALATAAIGINRGFFTGLENPVKATLWNTLASAGIKNPEIIIDAAFKSSADTYHKVLFAKANDIMSNPLAVQESLSQAILGTTYQTATAADAPAQTIEDRLSNFGTAVASADANSGAPTPKPSPAATTDQHVSSVVSLLGQRRGVAGR